LLSGVAALALLAAGSVYTVEAYSAEVFGPSSAARAPVSAPVMPGFTDLVNAVKPAVVSVRVKAEAGAHSVSDNGGANPFEGTPFERFFREFPGPNGQRAMPGQKQPRQFVQGQGSAFSSAPTGTS